MNYTAGALFCGIGGFCLGFESENIKTIWANDIDSEAISTYKLNFPTVNDICSDIRDIISQASNFQSVDVLHAGFPCQSFSMAGNRLGFNDDRGKLFFSMIDFIENMKQNKPKIIVLENSPYILIGEYGKWFDIIRNQIQKVGYWFNEKNTAVIDCRKHAGLPQRRERLFMVATSRDHFDSNEFRGSFKTKKTLSMLKMLDLGRVKDESYYLSEENKYGAWISKKAREFNEVRLFQLRKVELRPQPVNLCPTLTANMGLGGHNVPFILDNGKLRKLTELECLRLQGFPKNFKWSEMPRASKYRLIGNSVSPSVAKLLAIEVKSLLEGR